MLTRGWLGGLLGGWVAPAQQGAWQPGEEAKAHSLPGQAENSGFLTQLPENLAWNLLGTAPESPPHLFLL